MMVDSQNPYAAPQTDTAPPPGTEWMQGVSPSLTKTGWGLSLVYYGIVLVLLCAMVAGVSAAISGGKPGMAAVVSSVAFLGILLGFLLLFVGPLMCLAVPAESGAKGFVIGSVLLQVPSLLSAIFYQILPRVSPVAVSAVVQILGMISFVLFVLFLKRLAQYIGRADLCRRARNILVGLAILLSLGAVYVALLYSRILSIDIIYMFPLGIGVLIVFVMYANLVNDLRKTLAGK
jgi:hypothetical protein